MIAADATQHAARARRLPRRSLSLSLVALLAASLLPAQAAAVVATSISGKVTDQGGAPLAGITVQAGTVSFGVFTASGAPTSTGAAGTYSLSTATGRYAIRFSDPGQVHAAGFYSTGGFTLSALSATIILVADGPIPNINIKLPTSHKIAGTVTGTGSVPLANITVTAMTTNAMTVATATTAVNGSYALHVANGNFILLFSDPSKTYPSGYYTPGGLTTDFASATVVGVSGADVSGKNIQLPAARHITGTVTNALSAPLAGIQVTAGLASTTTNGSGAYSLVVPAGSYKVMVRDLTNARPSGYYVASGTGFTSSFAGATAVNVTLADAAGVNVQLPDGTTISGTVASPTGAPVAGIAVWLFSSGDVNPLATVTSAVNGTYVLRAAAGSYLLKYQDPTGAYASGFYKATVSGGFTKDIGSATLVAVVSSPVALVLVKPTLFDTVVRLAGTDRYGTAAAISKASYGSGVNVVYIATGLNFPDALAAAAAAGHLNGPVLLVATTSIPPATATELARLKPGRIVVTGGPSVVSDGVLTALKAYTAGAVQREAGTDRYGTAATISANAFSPGAPVAYIATGLNFPDALASAAAAGALDGPVLLVSTSMIPPVTAAELTRLKPYRIVVAGGPSVVSDTVLNALKAYTSGTVERQAGTDRFGTAAMISASTFPPGAPVAYIATGLNFPDALAAAAAAGRLGGPVLLVWPTSIPAVTAAELTRLKPGRIVVAGGPSVVSAGVMSALGAYLVP